MIIEPEINALESLSSDPVVSRDVPARLLTTSHHGERVLFPSNKGIHEIIEDQVRRTPNKTALIVGPQSFSYRELDERANRLARSLQDMGIGGDVPVGICLKRSVEMMVGLLGILKAGGCYVPLDPTYPAERLAFMLNDVKPTVVLTQTSLVDSLGLKSSNSHLLCVDEAHSDWRLFKSEPKSSPQSQIPDPESALISPNESPRSSLAYIIYTSGSTGRPKGVMITHRNVANFFSGMDGVLGTHSGVWLAVTSICFDISVLELFWTLARGFTVVLRSEEFATDVGPSIPEQIVQQSVTHLQCTPSLARHLVQSPATIPAIRQLRKFLLGGEALPASLARQLRQISGPDIFNMYGPTETTVWSAAHAVTDVPDNVPIGRPIANTDIHFLDEHFQPVPHGETGEIFIGGAGVARGYFERPELTLVRFVPDPFSHDTNARLYRTGDLGRSCADGVIEFLGRIDHQVKFGGHRIELGEIEAALQQHPEVRECVVHLREATPGDKRLVAYFVPTIASINLPTALRRFLEAKLPRQMVPSAIVLLEKLPLTPNGKIDRAALPDPGEIRPQLETPYLSPRRHAEATVAGIWRNVLHLEQIGVHDNFFDLGGNSLLLLETHAKTCAALGVATPVIRFFEHPTVAALAEFLSSQKAEAIAIQQRAQRQSEAFGRRSGEAVRL